MSQDAGQTLRRLVAPVYLPAILSAAGGAAVAPVVPLMALRLGFSVPAAAAMAMVTGVVAVAGTIPIGRVMQRWGERRCMVIAGLGLVATSAIGWHLVRAPGNDTGTRVAFLAVLIAMALGIQTWMLGRQTYLGTEVAVSMRARAMSTFGGMVRIGFVIGPALGALVLVGDHLERVFLLDLGLIAVATALVAVAMVPGETRGPRGQRSTASAARQVIEPREPSPYAPGRPAWQTMVLTGVGALPIIIARVGRPVILPLLGASLGLPATTIATIFAVAAVFDIAMFAPAGWLMDRRGRAAVAVPCLVVMGLGYGLLGFVGLRAGSLSSTTAALALGGLAVLIAIGNGFGAGIVMTLGLDVSPTHARTAHLARWNTLIGIGRLAAPAVVSLVTLVAPIAAAALVVGGFCLAGGAWLARWLPRVTPRPDAHE